jgi:hypothetical protein
MQAKKEAKEFSLLTKRMREMDLPKCPYQPAFDRCAVVMVPEDMATRETYARGGVIVKPEAKRSDEQKISARGVIVGAGLSALDVMKSHGIELGHIVWVARLSPWRHVIERTEKGDVEMLFMRVGDIVGSEDTLAAVEDGSLEVVVNDQDQHVYRGAEKRHDPPDYVA